MEQAAIIIIWIAIIKGITIGSEFNFYYWIKFGKKYTRWYFSRPSFRDYLKDEELNS